MELLGTYGNRDLVRSVSETALSLMDTNVIDTAVLQEISVILMDFLDNPDTEIRDTQIVGMLMYLKHHDDSDYPPVLMMLLEEAYQKITRHLLRHEILSECQGQSAEGNASGAGGVREPVRYIPRNGEFELPEPGKVTNLTVRTPDTFMKKNYVREVLIDSEGYVKKEIRSFYEDIYTDESEEIYSEAYLRALKEHDAKEV